MTLRYYIKKFDWLLLVLTLAIIGLGMVTFYLIGGEKSQVILHRQIFILIFGLILFFAVSMFDYRIFKNYSTSSVVIYGITVLLLVVVFAFRSIRGVESWISIGTFQFQPSEFAKLAVLILLAKYFSQKHVEIYKTRHILASGFYVAVPAFLTLIQPDLGSTIVFIALWIGILFFAGIKRKHLLGILMIGMAIVSMTWFFGLRQYQKDRILAFANPYIDPRGIGYNTIQAQTTFGSGQMFGILDNKAGDLNVLVPEPYTDFVVSSYAQKFGFFGILVLIFLLGALFLRIGNITSTVPNNFSKLFALGYLTIIFVHVVINMGMNMAILPITGIPFTFLSYGGSHLLTMLIGLGVVENIKLNS